MLPRIGCTTPTGRGGACWDLSHPPGDLSTLRDALLASATLGVVGVAAIDGQALPGDAVLDEIAAGYRALCASARLGPAQRAIIDVREFAAPR